ncbi:hypothetical protein BpOF4_21889 (plasmid) [Alkalihalophilus pseudofirmus OF4]|uniref:Uncharacterized protein n=1 Tax=Alkalihalophilus pseudofirmus (strain ATCC BAA-2126 / JCM 17055 / OF4) TaxID=398511 RepID=D3G1Z7_ALKPO|nr:MULTISPECIES: hypothetical protein [Alkalihalophilus]ADC52373.1 hypothetical protein BpOF4_21889 [Alkalihalophilus pseudofirmus OF4]MED1603450.1 hypothetical protein [Alkalihalophilus marmarensis]
MKILKAIDRFGIVSSSQLSEYLEGHLSHVTIYNSRPKLLKLGFIAEEKIGRTLVLYIRPSGIEYIGSQLTAFTKISYSKLNHQLIMNECLLAMKRLSEKRTKPFEFITERELRSLYIEQHFSQSDRRNTTKLKKLHDQIPDFVVIENHQRIAHEVELTQKSRTRYVKKFNMYTNELLKGRYAKVRYLCDTEQIKNVVTEVASGEQFRNDALQLELIERLMRFAKKE